MGDAQKEDECVKQRNKKVRRGRTGFSKKRMLSVLFLLFTAAACGILGCRFLHEYRQEKKRQEKLLEVKEKDGVDALKKKYPDMVGWVEIADTPFSYPVMQTKDDPQYYLHRDENGEYSFYGTPFLDARCSTDSDNLMIYGHNINGHRYFGYLQYFRESRFYRKHKNLTFTRVGGKKETYPVIAVVKTDIHADYYRYTDVYNDEEYRLLVKEMLSGSIYRCEAADWVEKEMNENTVEAFFHRYQFLTLSTCRTGEGKDKRLLVIGCRKKEEPVGTSCTNKNVPEKRL